MPESNGLKIEQEVNGAKITMPMLSNSETEQKTFVINRINKAKDQRDQRLHEFNGLDFMTDDQANRDIRNSYIRPKINDDEVRINTGTVEKKMISVVNEILNLNMQPEVNAYDENDKMVQELGEVFTNLLKRTNEQENAEDLDFPMLWDLATRRVLFVEEYQDEKECVDKRKTKYDLETGEIEYTTKNYKISRPKKRILDGRTVLFGDMSIPNNRYNDQPYIIKYDRMHWRTAWGIYHNYKNWKYIKPGGPAVDNTWFGGQFDWRMYSGIAEDEVEVIHYFSYPDDEYQIIINGVPMLAPGTPLPWEYEGYSIQAFVSREMEQNLAYGQLFTINAKVLAGLSDEMLRLIVRKWRQSIEPSIAVKGNKVLSRDIWNPGAVAQGIDPANIKKLVDNVGVTQSEMATFQMISDKIEAEVGVSKLFQGQTDKKLTATQALEQMKQAVKAIGTLVLSWSRVVKTMAYLRIYNIIENNTQPLEIKYTDGQLQKIFRQFTVNNVKLDNNTNGSMVIEMTDRDMSPEEEQAIYDYEQEEGKKGNHVRYKQINVEKLREFRYRWYVSVIPQEKESSALQKIMFTDQLNQAAGIMNLTGRRINSETIINDYERIWKKRNMFEQSPPPQPVQAPGMAGGTEVPKEMAQMAESMGNTPIADQVGSVVSAGTKRPSINSAVGQAM